MPAPATSAETAALLPPSDYQVDTAPMIQLSAGPALVGASSTMHEHKLRKGKSQAPIDTATLRRSNRSNKYDGFRTNLLTESRTTKSKVKPRLLPSALPGTKEMEENTVNTTDETVPPPTPVSTMQNIGTQLCAIPAEELSDEILSDRNGGSTSESI